MALHNPSNLFTNGLVKLDSRPYLNYYLKQEAHKQAKDEALDKYYGNLPNTINEQGLRDNEVPVLHRQKDNIQQYWMQNRDAIKRGNTPEAFNIGKMFRDAQGTVQLSKNRAATDKQLAIWRKDPSKEYIFEDPDFMERLHKHGLAIDDPDSEAIDLAQIDIPPPPFDMNKFSGTVKIKPDYDKPIYQDIPGDKFNRLEITPQKLSTNDLEGIQNAAASEFYRNPYAVKKYIKQRLENEPEFANKIKDFYEKNYKTSPETDLDIFTAAIGLSKDLTPTQRTVKNEQALMDERQRKAKELVAYRNAFKKHGKDGNDSEVNDVWEKANEQMTNQESYTKNKGRDVANAYVPMNTLPSDAATVIIEAGRKLNPDVTLATSYLKRNSEGTLDLYVVDDNGNPQARPDPKYRVMTVQRVGTNLKQQPGVAEKREVVAKGEPNKQKPVVHEGYSRKELLANGWTEDKIKKAVKAGKLKLSD